MSLTLTPVASTLSNQNTFLVAKLNLFLGGSLTVMFRPDHENIIFFSWAAMGVEGGVTKCQTDSQWCRPDDYLIGHRRRAPRHILYLCHLPQLSSQPQCIRMEACYPQSVVFAAFGVWQLHPRCGTVSDLPQRRWDAAVMRGPRCILGSSLHIFQHFHSKCETLKVGNGNNYSHRCTTAEENTALIFLIFGQTICVRNDL